MMIILYPYQENRNGSDQEPYCTPVLVLAWLGKSLSFPSSPPIQAGALMEQH